MKWLISELPSVCCPTVLSRRMCCCIYFSLPWNIQSIHFNFCWIMSIYTDISSKWQALTRAKNSRVNKSISAWFCLTVWNIENLSNSGMDMHAPFLKMCTVWGRSDRGNWSTFSHLLYWSVKGPKLQLTFLCLLCIYSQPHLHSDITRILVYPGLKFYLGFPANILSVCSTNC